MKPIEYLLMASYIESDIFTSHIIHINSTIYDEQFAPSWKDDPSPSRNSRDSIFEFAYFMIKVKYVHYKLLSNTRKFGGIVSSMLSV